MHRAEDERARVNVTNAIRALTSRIVREHPPWPISPPYHPNRTLLFLPSRSFIGAALAVLSHSHGTVISCFREDGRTVGSLLTMLQLAANPRLF